MMVSFLSPITGAMIGGQLLSVTSWQGIFGTLRFLGTFLADPVNIPVGDGALNGLARQTINQNLIMQNNA